MSCVITVSSLYGEERPDARGAFLHLGTMDDARTSPRLLYGLVGPGRETLHVGLTRMPGVHPNLLWRWSYVMQERVSDIGDRKEDEAYFEGRVGGARVWDLRRRAGYLRCWTLMAWERTHSSWSGGGGGRKTEDKRIEVARGTAADRYKDSENTSNCLHWRGESFVLHFICIIFHFQSSS